MMVYQAQLKTLEPTQPALTCQIKTEGISYHIYMSTHDTNYTDSCNSVINKKRNSKGSHHQEFSPHFDQVSTEVILFKYFQPYLISISQNGCLVLAIKLTSPMFSIFDSFGLDSTRVQAKSKSLYVDSNELNMCTQGTLFQHKRIRRSVFYGTSNLDVVVFRQKNQC